MGFPFFSSSSDKGDPPWPWKPRWSWGAPWDLGTHLEETGMKLGGGFSNLAAGKLLKYYLGILRYTVYLGWCQPCFHKPQRIVDFWEGTIEVSDETIIRRNHVLSIWGWHYYQWWIFNDFHWKMIYNCQFLMGNRSTNASFSFWIVGCQMVPLKYASTKGQISMAWTKPSSSEDPPQNWSNGDFISPPFIRPLF